MAKIHLAPLDPKRKMIAQRDFLCRGKNYKRGQKFNNSSVPLRTLRILYEGRSIGYPDDKPKTKPIAQTRISTIDRKAELLKITNKDLITALEKLRVTVDPRWNKNRLADEIVRAEYASNG